MAVEEAPVPFKLHPKEKKPFLKRASTKIVAPFLAAGLAAGGFTAIRNLGNAPEKSPTPTSPTTPSPSHTESPKPQEIHGILYKPEGIAWKGFGGFDINMRTDDGVRLGFSNKKSGPKDLFNQLIKMIAYQKSMSINNIVDILKNSNGKITLKLPVENQNLPYYLHHSPSYIKPSKTQLVDFSKPFIIEQNKLPGAEDTVLITGDSKWLTSLTAINGQLRFTESDSLPLSGGQYLSFVGGWESSRLETFMEATARINEALSYPTGSEHAGKDFLSAIMNYPRRSNPLKHILDDPIFVKENQAHSRFFYSLLGPLK